MPNSKRLRIFVKRFLRFVFALFVLLISLFFLFANSFRGVDERTISFYYELKDSLRSQGYKPRLMVTSTKRTKWFNDLAVKYSGAAPKSRHLKAEAIDFIVFDVNGDWKADFQDVDIVYNILNKQIIRNKGGIGTYKNAGMDRQMIHIDCRGRRARWNR